MGQIDAQGLVTGPPHVIMKAELREAMVNAINIHAMTEHWKGLAASLPPRCSCCWETRHVARDTYAGSVMVCRRCDYQLCANGACRLHNGPVLFPELVRSNDPVPSPPEIEALFYVRESEHSKYDAAELADADV